MTDQPSDRDTHHRDLATELADALDMLLSVATDERSRLPKGELYTNMALNGARSALAKAVAAGLLSEAITPTTATDDE
jgi:hypothetical protein